MFLALNQESRDPRPDSVLVLLLESFYILLKGAVANQNRGVSQVLMAEKVVVAGAQAETPAMQALF